MKTNVKIHYTTSVPPKNRCGIVRNRQKKMQKQHRLYQKQMTFQLVRT